MPDQEMIEFAKNFLAACEKMAAALDVNVDCNLTVAEVRAVVDWMHVVSQPGIRAMTAVATRADLEAMIARVVGS